MSDHLTDEYLAADAGYNPSALDYPVAEVVPVTIVDEVLVKEYPARTVTTDQVPVATLPVRVAGEVRTRTRLRVRPVGGAVYLGGQQNVTPGSGFLVPAGERVDVAATAALYAVATDPAVILHVLSEHRDG